MIFNPKLAAFRLRSRSGVGGAAPRRTLPRDRERLQQYLQQREDSKEAELPK
jgi:hypothetical protein